MFPSVILHYLYQKNAHKCAVLHDLFVPAFAHDRRISCQRNPFVPNAPFLNPLKTSEKQPRNSPRQPAIAQGFAEANSFYSNHLVKNRLVTLSESYLYKFFF